MNRIDLINLLVRERGYERYLEIGCASDACFSKVEAHVKVGVDPASGGTLRMTSDEFFALATKPFDLVLIDGDHHHDQVFQDLTNALRLVRPEGTILMHDCLPATRLHETSMFCGTAWRAFAKVRERPDLEAFCLDLDWGVGIVRRMQNSEPIFVGRSMDVLSYDDLLEHRETWMRPISSWAVRDVIARDDRDWSRRARRKRGQPPGLLVLGKSEEEISRFVERSPHAAREARLDLVANPDKSLGDYARIANAFVDRADEDVVGIVHADTTFGVGTISAMAAETEGPRIVGMVGRSPEAFVWGKDGGGYVSTLDSCCVFFRKDAGLRFDGDTFDDFHCLVEDLCLQAAAREIPSYVPPLYAEHIGLIDRAPDWMSNYWRYRSKLAFKWSDIDFMTTGD